MNEKSSKIRNIFSQYWRLQKSLSVKRILQYQYKRLVTTATDRMFLPRWNVASTSYLSHSFFENGM